MRISDWSSDVCSSDLILIELGINGRFKLDASFVRDPPLHCVEALDSVERRRSPTPQGPYAGVFEIALPDLKVFDKMLRRPSFADTFGRRPDQQQFQIVLYNICVPRQSTAEPREREARVRRCNHGK